MQKLVYVILFVGLTYSFAYENSNDSQRELRTPPTEAITICEGKSQGDSCSMNSPRGDSLDGTCENTPDGKYFACKPENMNSRGGRPPKM